MATATEVIANETEIKQAMGVLGLDGLTAALLDEIELQKQLKFSLEQADKGELIPANEVKKEIGELFATSRGTDFEE
jgi:hypothetical protein